jgi:hypothetical protein
LPNCTSGFTLDVGARGTGGERHFMDQEIRKKILKLLG